MTIDNPETAAAQGEVSGKKQPAARPGTRTAPAQPGTIVQVQPGTSILELAGRFAEEERPLSIVGALFNGRVMGLEHRISRPCRIGFLTIRSEQGADIYRRSLSMLLHAAYSDLFGHRSTLKIEHSLSRGYFFRHLNQMKLDRRLVTRIQGRMLEMVGRDIPFGHQEVEVEHALELFETREEWDRYFLLKYGGAVRVVLHNLLDFHTPAQGPLVPSTGYLGLFKLVPYQSGVILLFPGRREPDRLPRMGAQKKLFQIYSEQRAWSELMDVDSAGKLNRAIIKGGIDQLIWLSEGLHEKKIASIADTITRGADEKRVIFLAGPSSSGKTTFAKRLTIQMMANGVRPRVIALDNYFLPRERMPRDALGVLDFDSLHALDLELIQEQIQALLHGERIQIPRYDFKTGNREPPFPVKLEKDQIVILEGIHCMNPELTGVVSRSESTRIYISALTQLNLDVVNRIPTSSVRLIRRIVRDHQFRNYTASQTLAAWPMVRRGEDRNIFPFQEEADLMFNSSLVYEMSVLKAYVEPLLLDIGEEDPAYTKARQLLRFTSNFMYLLPDYVPFTSILREFIGGSGFRY